MELEDPFITAIATCTWILATRLTVSRYVLPRSRFRNLTQNTTALSLTFSPSPSKRVRRSRARVFGQPRRARPLPSDATAHHHSRYDEGAARDQRDARPAQGRQPAGADDEQRVVVRGPLAHQVREAAHRHVVEHGTHEGQRAGRNEQ